MECWQQHLGGKISMANTVDGPAKSESPVENAAKHPTTSRVSTIQGGAGFRTHPQYVYYNNIYISYIAKIAGVPLSAGLGSWFLATFNHQFNDEQG